MQDFINNLTVIISHSRYAIKRDALNLQSRLFCKIVNALARSDIITLPRYRATVRSGGGEGLLLRYCVAPYGRATYAAFKLFFTSDFFFCGRRLNRFGRVSLLLRVIII